MKDQTTEFNNMENLVFNLKLIALFHLKVDVGGVHAISLHNNSPPEFSFKHLRLSHYLRSSAPSLVCNTHP